MGGFFILENLCFKNPKVTLVSANQKKIYEVPTCIIAKMKFVNTYNFY